MDIEITELKENPLFERKDVRFVLKHDGATTPARAQVRQLIAAQIGTKTENVVIDHMESASGMAATRGLARAYKSAEAARKAEPAHLQKRNNLWIEPAKKEKPTGAPADAKPKKGRGAA